MSKLVDEFAALLGIGESEPNSLSAYALDKRIDESLFMEVHMTIFRTTDQSAL